MNQQPSQPHDSRSLVAIFLCIVFYLGYQKYISWKYPDLQKAPSVAKSGEIQPQASQDSAEVLTTKASAGETAPKGNDSESIQILDKSQLFFETPQNRWVFSQENGGLESVTLKNYRSEKDREASPVNLLDSPMSVQALTTRKSSDTADSAKPFHAERLERGIRFWRQLGGFKVTQEYHIPEDGYLATLKVTYENVTSAHLPLYSKLSLESLLIPQKASNILGFIPGVVTHQDQIVSFVANQGTWTPLKDFCAADETQHKGTQSSLKYLGIDRHYFLALMIPKETTTDFSATRLKASDARCEIAFTMGSDLGTIEAGKSYTLEYSLFMGPKDLSVLSGMTPNLSSAMHLGFFDFIARPLMLVIDSFYKVLKNYGLAIIFLTILLKVLFYPLVKASQVSMFQMKKLNPQMAAIREKWKDDKARQQQELLKFMSQHKINPMKGCLPILPQIPVFFAFYQVLQTSIHLRHAPFFGWIQDLSAMDPFLVTPLLMGVAMFIQQKMTPTTGMDKTQEKILLFMPVMFTAMMLTLPAGLTLYMLTNTVVGIGQQRWLMRKLESGQAK